MGTNDLKKEEPYRTYSGKSGADISERARKDIQLPEIAGATVPGTAFGFCCLHYHQFILWCLCPIAGGSSVLMGLIL